MRRRTLSMRLPEAAHTSRPWRILEITEDFQVEDVWALPTTGGPGELPALVSRFFAGNFPEGAPLIVRTLWEARWKVGAVFGWDKGSGIGSRVASLKQRLPVDLPSLPPDPAYEPFTPLYLLEDEWAAELANRTVHAVMHLSWASDGSGGYRGQMAVLVKPNGWFGTAYMAAIKPARILLVYPALLRRLGHIWQQHVRDGGGPA